MCDADYSKLAKAEMTEQRFKLFRTASEIGFKVSFQPIMTIKQKGEMVLSEGL